MTEYLGTDNRRLSYAELWRISSSWRAFAQGARMKLLNLRNVPRTGIASDGPYFIEPDSIPVVAADKLACIINDCRPLGFTPCHWFKSSSIGPSEGFGVLMLHAGRAMYAGAIYTRVAIKTSIRDEMSFYATTRVSDGRFMSTGNAKTRFDSPPEIDGVNMPGHHPQAVVEKHQERLAKVGAHMVVPLDERLVAETLKEVVMRIQCFHRDRGVWVPLSADEISAIIGNDRGG
jgi:hypothetical protein